MSWVICPWISKNAINHFVYILTHSFLHKFWLYLYRVFITLRSCMSSILKEILNDGTRVTDPWFYENCVILPCLHSSIRKFKAIFMKHCDNVGGHKISNEFDYGLYLTSMSLVICPWIHKNAIFHLFSVSIVFISSPILITFKQSIYYYD